MKPAVLFVDDEPQILDTLKDIFSNFYTVYTAENAQKGLDYLGKFSIQVVVSDQRMPGMTGTEFLKICKDKYPDTVRILVTGFSDLDLIIETINTGDIFRFISKPWKIEKLKETIDLAVQLYDQVKAVKQKTDPSKPASQVQTVVPVTPRPSGLHRKQHLLFVDENQVQISNYQELFAQDYIVHSATSAEKAFEALAQFPVAVLICEAQIGETDGIDFISVIRDDYPNVVPILLTDIKDIELAVRLINEGRIFRYFIKPYRKEHFYSEMEKAVAQHLNYLNRPELNIRKIEDDLISPKEDKKPQTLSESLKMTRDRLNRRVGY